MSDPTNPFLEDEDDDDRFEGELIDDAKPFDLETWPLDPPEVVDHDWGGDGSDPLRPVRAHVLAALQPSAGPYPPPLDALLTLGITHPDDERRDALGLSQEHVPDLVRMARDRGLFTASSNTPEVWAVNHALHALNRLDATAVAADLVPLFDLEDDWLPTQLNELFATIGEPALAPLGAYLADLSRWAWGHSYVTDALTKMVERHPAVRERVVALLRDVLRQAETYSEQSVTGAMSGLVDLKEVEALPLIRRAFELDKIDEMMLGSWGMILEEFDLDPDPDDPLVAVSEQRYKAQHAQLAYSMGGQQSSETKSAPQRASGQRKQDQARKAKQKRKAASKARKTNQKKKRK